MKLAEALIAWNPGTDQVRVGSLITDADRDWTDPYSMTGGAAYVPVRELTGINARHYVMSEFLGIVVRDQVDLMSAYREFLKIDEFANAIPPDMPKLK